MIFTSSEALDPKRLKTRQRNKNLPQQNDEDDDDEDDGGGGGGGDGDDDDMHPFYYLMTTKAITHTMLQLMFILTIKYPLKSKLFET